MIRPHLPLNSLRAFEAAARHLSFTKAAIELCVTPGALSHQVKALEDRLAVPLFLRLPRGLALTDEGRAMLPVLRECFDKVATLLESVEPGGPSEIVTLSVVGTFACAWLFPRLHRFEAACPFVDVRISTNNNRVDLVEEGLDLAIRFGSGTWDGIDAELLLEAPFAPLCAPGIATRISEPSDLLRERLLRSYRTDDWTRWFAKAGLTVPVVKGPMFDSSRLMVDAALQGFGVALAPAAMFEAELASGRLRQPLANQVSFGSYWLTSLNSKPFSKGMELFSEWVRAEAHAYRASLLPDGKVAERVFDAA